MTAAHLQFEAQKDGTITGITVHYMYGTGAAQTLSGVVSSLTEVQGAYTATNVANAPYDVGIFRLSSAASVANSSLWGLGARIDGTSLEGHSVTAYGFPTQTSDPSGPLPVIPGDLATNGGTISDASGGYIHPISGTQAYEGNSGAPIFASDASFQLTTSPVT
jgi:hypothetical protein